MRTQAQLCSLFLRPTAPPLLLGIVVAVSFIAVESVSVWLVKQITGEDHVGVLYVLGVFVVSTVWGWGLAATTSVASALAFTYFRDWPALHFSPIGDGVVVAVFLVVTSATNFIAGSARARALEADERRHEVSVLAEQQAALRRVATRVARGGRPSAVFAAVAEEIVRCLDIDVSAVWRYASNSEIELVATHSKPGSRFLPVGERLSLEGDNLGTMVLRSGRAARHDAFDNSNDSAVARIWAMGVRAAVGAPVIVDGRVWGVAVAGSTGGEPMPPDSEERIEDFADLVATALANAATRDELQTSRDALRELAERQAALRRVATLVARGANPSQVYSAVADEIVRCLNVNTSGVWRYEPDNAITLVAGKGRAGSQYLSVGERLTIEGDNLGATVLRSGRAARHNMVENAACSVVARLSEVGIREGVGAPIIVGGRVWGFVVAASKRSEPLPSDSEERIADFADLVGIALSNAYTRNELIASRARIVAAADDARRRLERDLHDGAQQRLVSLGMQLRMVEACVPPEQQGVKKELSGVLSGLTEVSRELQEISRGIHPAILSKGGLGPALDTLAQRSCVPVALDLLLDRRLPKPVEVGAYYVVAEALTNAAKYAQASEVNVRAEIDDENFCLMIRDNGKGGADHRKGSGLVGLIDRVEALGGHIHIVSPPGTGTTLFITVPLRETDS